TASAPPRTAAAGVPVNGRVLRPHIGGYATSTWRRSARGECIARGAFRGVLARKTPVGLWMNHDDSIVLASTHDGTLHVVEDTRGLWFEARLPDTAVGRRVLADVRTNVIRGASIGAPDCHVTRDANGRTIEGVEL